MYIGFLLLFSILFSVGNGETVQTVVVRTADCFSCGMVEDVSQLDIKICGDKSCCFIQHLDNSDTNFRPGDEDRFDGAGGLLECYQYELGDANSGFGPMEITVFHEGTDGVKLDSVAIETDLRTVECTIGEKLDDGEFFNTRCF